MGWLPQLVFASVLSAVFVAPSAAWADDTTPPTAPGQPKEGATRDQDYDKDGDYTVYWAAAEDLESGIAAYELGEKIGPDGQWTSLSNTIPTNSYSITGRLHNTQYFYKARAQNGAGLWGPLSRTSDGILVDTTKPTAVTVTDDGTVTNSTTTLHATWTASSDPESGILGYQYLIRQDSPSGPIIVDWTSAGLALEGTHTGLSLVNGTTYFIGVRAYNGAKNASVASYSDGITVDITAPVVEITSPEDGAVIGP